MLLFGQEIRLVIWDLDGVLLDVMAEFENNVRSTAHEYGLAEGPITEHFVATRAGHVKVPGNIYASTWMMWPELDDDAVSRFVCCFHQHEYTNPYPLIEGTREVLEWFRVRGIPMALATNNPGDVLMRRLASSDIDVGLFDAIATMDSGCAKPDPAFFDPIFATVSVALEHALFVGDLEIDWEAAQARGISFIAVLTGGTSREKFLGEGVPVERILPRAWDIISLIEE